MQATYNQVTSNQNLDYCVPLAVAITALIVPNHSDNTNVNVVAGLFGITVTQSKP